MIKKSTGKYLMALVGALLLLLTLSPPTTAQELPRFEPASCPVDVPDDLMIDCGTLIAPENYDQPKDGIVRLPVIIIHSPNPAAAPDPILFTEGGPGFSSLGSVWWLARSDFVNGRDVVILEQRGNRYAQPSLACDASMWLTEEAGHTSCLDGLQGQGIDLTHFTTEAIVHDINSLRQVLDYPAWNLLGSSYSTRLMLLTMHLYPDGIRAVVLDSVSALTETRYEHDPEHAARALRVMFDDCAADPACAAAYPDLAARFYRLVSRLNAEPIPVEVRRSGGAPDTVEVTGHLLLEWMVVDSFYDPVNPQHLTSYMPLLIDQLEKGNTDLLTPWVLNYPKALYTSDDFAWGLYFAINCQDDAPHGSTAVLAAQSAAYPELDGYVRQGKELEICEAWQLPPARPFISEPVQSEIPTLILAGSYDPITPPEWGRAAAAHLPNSHFYEFPASGHGALSQNDCAAGLVQAFLADPLAALDESCMAEVPQPVFVRPEEVIINPHLYEIHFGELGYTQTEEIVAKSGLMILLAASLILLIAGVVWLVYGRKRGRPVNRDIVFTGLAAGTLGWLLTGFTFAFSEALRATAVAAPPMLRFGLPAQYRLLLSIPAVGAVLAVALIIMTLRLWRRGAAHWLSRLFFTVAALAAVVVTIIFARWQMIL